MADSRLLHLYQACRQLQERLTQALVARLRARGYTRVTPAHLMFLGQLECGETHAAELARQTGISRQAVHKQVKELAGLGLLAERDGQRRGHRRAIVFTDRGVQLMADCRAILAEMDAQLPAGPDALPPEDAVAFLSRAAERLGSDTR